MKTCLQSSIVDPEPPIQNLVLIAVDRFGAVILPLRSSLISSKLWPFFILCTWTVAIAVNSPELFALKQENWCVSGIGMRLLESPHPLRITSCPTKLYSIFLIPLALIAVLYIII